MSHASHTLVPPRIVFCLAGIFTGFISFYTTSGFLDASETTHVIHFNGVFFGFAVSTMLVGYMQISPVKAFLIILAFGVSWEMAFWFAFWFNGFWTGALFGYSGPANMFVDLVYVLACGVAGFIGAGVIMLSLATLIQRFRDRIFYLRILVAGTLVALMLPLVGFGVLLIPFFVAWQGIAAFLIGHVVEKANGEECECKS